MADLAATDITVTMLNQRQHNGRSYFNLQLAFGDGVKTYPAGGIPIDTGKLGCPAVVESLVFYDTASTGYDWRYDRTNKKLKCVTHSHDLFLKNADQTDAAGNRVNAASNKLGANTGSNVTVAAISDTTASGGIVANQTTGNGAEPATVAIPAQTLRCEVVGW